MSIRRDFERQGDDWTPKDIAELERLWADGYRQEEIAEMLGRDAIAVQSARRRLGLQSFPGRCLKRKRPNRACITCGAPFHSTGNHHRMCDRCRQA